MGFIKSLFGKTKLDTPGMLSAVARSGGTGIVPIPYDALSSYLCKHGLEGKINANVMRCFFILDGIFSTVTIDRGKSSGLTSDQTLVEISRGIDFKRVSKDEIAALVEKGLSQFITDSDSAHAVSWQIFKMGESDYLHARWDLGELSNDIERLRPPLITKFNDKGHKDVPGRIDWHRFQSARIDFTAPIADLKDKLDIHHLTAELIIKKWGLVD